MTIGELRRMCEYSILGNLLYGQVHFWRKTTVYDKHLVYTICDNNLKNQAMQTGSYLSTSFRAMHSMCLLSVPQQPPQI